MIAWLDVVMLLSAGLAAGFVAGLTGVGGGSLFAPVLLFYFRSQGVAPVQIAPLTAGTSLLCVLLASSASAWSQHRRGAVAWRFVGLVGGFSAVAVFLVTRLVATQPWYSQYAFQVVFSGVLLVVGLRMLQPARWDGAGEPDRQAGWPLLMGTGAAAGAVSAATGVGGGVVLVPAYHRFLRLPMKRAVGTSSATIVLIAAIGVASYAASEANALTSFVALGYVDVGRALFLAGPALVSARLGVKASHRIKTHLLRRLFAGLMLLVAGKLLWEVLG